MLTKAYCQGKFHQIVAADPQIFLSTCEVVNFDNTLDAGRKNLMGGYKMIGVNCDVPNGSLLFYSSPRRTTFFKPGITFLR
jgi:hypothetical protein